MNRQMQRQYTKRSGSPTYKYKIKRTRTGRVLVNTPDKYGYSMTIAVCSSVKEARKYISSLVNNEGA